MGKLLRIDRESDGRAGMRAHGYVKVGLSKQRLKRAGVASLHPFPLLYVRFGAGGFRNEAYLAASPGHKFRCDDEPRRDHEKRLPAKPSPKAF